MPAPAFSLHAHFYQPLRGNPFDDDRTGKEDGAEPYLNWNEKVLAECYRPNAALGTLELVGFDVAPSLLGWMKLNGRETYERFLQSNRRAVESTGAGNALPVPLIHAILPLANARDKATRIRWGLAWHRHHFGDEAAGMWLPEMAVDLPTLQALHDAGVEFTVLSQAQIRDSHALPDAGPYWVKLPERGRIAVYVRDDDLSNQLSFGLSTLGGAGHWARTVLAPRRRTGARLILVATVGETFGHHYRGEEHFLHWLMRHEAASAGFIPVTLAQDFRSALPETEVQIHENSSWACAHGVERWEAGCPCSPGNSGWKTGLRRAFDHLGLAIDAALGVSATAVNADPWTLRNDFIQVVMGARTWDEFVSEHRLARVKKEAGERLRTLLWAEYYAQRTSTSAAFHYDAPDRLETRIAIANAARAVQLTNRVTGESIGSALRDDLARVRSDRSGKTGAVILDEIVAQAQHAMAG